MTVQFGTFTADYIALPVRYAVYMSLHVYIIIFLVYAIMAARKMHPYNYIMVPKPVKVTFTSYTLDVGKLPFIDSRLFPAFFF